MMSQPLINISRKQALLFAGFLVFYEFLVYIANDMIMPGMLKVVQYFHASETAVATSLTAYVLGGASLQLLLGPISDRYGRRPVMLFGALLFFMTTFLIAGSYSIRFFLVMRFFEGMGLCFIAVIGYATLQEIFSEMDAVRLVAIMANVGLLAPLLGPLAGAMVLLYLSWQSIFILIGALAVIAWFGLWRYMPESVGACKKDGSSIPRVSLAPKVIVHNYVQLILNPAFILGSIAVGLLATACIVWIGISPIIIIKEAHLGIMDYALWQIPIFGAGILGNWYLHYLSHYHTLKKLIVIGSTYVLLGLLLTYLLPQFVGEYFLWLMPGLTLYGFGIGITTGPLYRQVLFSTKVSKGTAAALLGMISLAVQGLAVEIGKWVYVHHSNAALGLYCLSSGVLYLICMIRVQSG